MKYWVALIFCAAILLGLMLEATVRIKDSQDAIDARLSAIETAIGLEAK